MENSPTVHCYDAVWMTNISLAIIDCTRPGLFTPIENVFYYVNTTDKTTLDQKVKTDMYVPFTMMRRRKIFLLEEEGESFLIRAYFADAIDEQYR